MTTQHETLPDRLGSTPTGIAPGIHVPLIRLLAEGEPVTIAELAAASAQLQDAVREALEAAGDAEYDEEGSIIGLGLTLRPTPHRFTVAGEQLYTWCALDTLIFPALIGKAATVESTSPTSGTTIRVRVADDGTAASVHPSTAVVSLVEPDAPGSVRSSFCNQVHYFASHADAQPWIDAHPGGEIVDVATAHRTGATMASALLDAAAIPAPAAQDSSCAPDRAPATAPTRTAPHSCC